MVGALSDFEAAVRMGSDTICVGTNPHLVLCTFPMQFLYMHRGRVTD